MDTSPYKNSESRSSHLKTTTWGGVIGLALLIAGLGLTGHLSRSIGNSQIIESADNIAPNELAALSSNVTDHSAAGSSARSLNKASTHPLPFEFRGNRAVWAQFPSAANGNEGLSARTATGFKDQLPGQAPASAAASGGTGNPQNVTASKISPDLR